MEPPNGFDRLAWSLWTDGREHLLQLRDRGEVLAFLTEFGKQCRKRKLREQQRQLNGNYVMVQAVQPEDADPELVGDQYYGY